MTHGDKRELFGKKQKLAGGQGGGRAGSERRVRGFSRGFRFTWGEWGKYRNTLIFLSAAEQKSFHLLVSLCPSFKFCYGRCCWEKTSSAVVDQSLPSWERTALGHQWQLFHVTEQVLHAMAQSWWSAVCCSPAPVEGMLQCSRLEGYGRGQTLSWVLNSLQMLEYLIYLFSWAVLELRTLMIKEGWCRALKLLVLQQITSFRLHVSVFFRFIDASSESQTVKALCSHSLLSLPEMWPWKAKVSLFKRPHHTWQHRPSAPDPTPNPGWLRACVWHLIEQVI